MGRVLPERTWTCGSRSLEALLRCGLAARTDKGRFLWLVSGLWWPAVLVIDGGAKKVALTGFSNFNDEGQIDL